MACRLLAEFDKLGMHTVFFQQLFQEQALTAQLSGVPYIQPGSGQGDALVQPLSPGENAVGFGGDRLTRKRDVRHMIYMVHVHTAKG